MMTRRLIKTALPGVYMEGDVTIAPGEETLAKVWIEETHCKGAGLAKILLHYFFLNKGIRIMNSVEFYPLQRKTEIWIRNLGPKPVYFNAGRTIGSALIVTMERYLSMIFWENRGPRSERARGRPKAEDGLSPSSKPADWQKRKRGERRRPRELKDHGEGQEASLKFSAKEKDKQRARKKRYNQDIIKQDGVFIEAPEVEELDFKPEKKQGTGYELEDLDELDFNDVVGAEGPNTFDDL